MKEEKIKQEKTHRKYSVRVFLILLFVFVASASIYTFAEQDAEQVIIENVSSYVLDASVIIYWDTNILSDSLVKYGLSPENLDNSNYFGVHSYSHAAEIQGLQPNTLYYYAVNSTNANGNSNESEIYSFTTLEDNLSPVYSNLNALPVSGDNYSEDNNYTFSVDWKDNGIIENVIIQHNFSGIVIQENMTNVPGTDAYEFSASGLAAGNYSWKTICVDSAGNTNESPELVYIVNKDESVLELYLNGIQQNIDLEQKSYVNITGFLAKGDSGIRITVSNSSGIINQSAGEKTAEMLHFFSTPGVYNVSMNYNESQNYTSGSKQFSINVTPIELNLFIDKPDYVLGESVSYIVFAPNGSNISIEICGPLPVGGGFAECKSVNSAVHGSYPLMGVSSFSNKSGNYRIRAQMNYKGLTKYAEKNYTVSNNIQLTISGDLILKTGEESELTAAATGGVGTLRYNWTLSNGTKISGQNLNVKYSTAGSYPVIITVTDDYGNYKSETRTLSVKKHYKIKVAVLDNENGGDLSGAKVKMENDQETTNTDGEADFDLIEGSYYLKVSSSGYLSYSETISADANKTITVKLSKAPVNTNDPLDIILISPSDGEKLTSSTVEFEANVDLGGNTAATCMFYVSENNNEWYRVMKTVSVQNSGVISYTETFSAGSAFSWKVQCEANSKTYASKSRKFYSGDFQEQPDASLTIIGNTGLNDSIIDAGEIRRRIDEAYTNLESLDMESKKDAEALQALAKIDSALKDYERAMRDINNVKYRRDLSAAEQEAKRLEYYAILRGFENVTPLEIRNLGAQTFISYPSKEELKTIAEDYQAKRNIMGKVNEEKLFALQNGIIVTTRISNVEITYMNGKIETITLVDKIIKITDNATDTFLLEFVPKEIAGNSDEITLLLDEYKVINEDPLLKIDKQGRIIYYVSGQKDLELGKKTKTVILSDTQFSTKTSLTGAVTLSSIEWTSPTSLIILIIIISCIYLLYAFDVFGSLFEKSKKKLEEEKINKILSLIKDASEFLQNKEIDKADLIFKEIKLLYEGSSEVVRQEVYSEAIILLEMIDSAQMELLLQSAEKSSKMFADSQSKGNLSEEERKEISNSRETLKKAYALLSDSLKQKYKEEVDSLVNISKEEAA